MLDTSIVYIPQRALYLTYIIMHISYSCVVWVILMCSFNYQQNIKRCLPGENPTDIFLCHRLQLTKLMQ
uniref:Uncharacterized protein n=1 Tax=Gasterosteus aculeatus TaxID=69293 RepID=G3NJ50_GASAC